MPLSCRYSCPSVKTTTAVSADEPRSPSTFCIPQSSLDAISVPSNFVPSHAAVERERGSCPRCPGARSEHRRHDSIAVPVDRVKLRPSHRTIFITTTSSSEAPKKPSQWCSELGDRHHLLQLRPASSIFNSTRSTLRVDRAVVVNTEFFLAVEPFQPKPLLSKPRRSLPITLVSLLDKRGNGAAEGVDARRDGGR
uniref:Uncharacterized protein n=1 Tax=Oryza rufipogon TaxID=4529 RepID=A0A0E0N0M5_ORYRU